MTQPNPTSPYPDPALQEISKIRSELQSERQEKELILEAVYGKDGGDDDEGGRERTTSLDEINGRAEDPKVARMEVCKMCTLSNVLVALSILPSCPFAKLSFLNYVAERPCCACYPEAANL